ncbi:MAG: tetratricopeptide repeat protein [Bacteroidia bacterium]|nr:tetratricopeptide repeat protein [Bacteroidia bacterium]
MKRLKLSYFVTIWVSYWCLSIFTGFGQLPSQTNDKTTYSDALELFYKGKYSAAQKQFEVFLGNIQFYPEAVNDLIPNVRFYHAVCSYHLLRNNAESLLEHFLYDFPFHAHQDEARFFLGKLLFIKRKYPDALPVLEEIERRELAEDLRQEAVFMRGYCQFQTKQLKPAETAFSQVKNGNSPFKESAAYYLGVVQYQQERYSEALNAFRSVENSPTYGAKVPLYIATCLLQAKRYEELGTYGKKLLSNDSLENQSSVYLLVGTSLFYQKEYKESIPFLQGSPQNAATNYLLGYALFQEKRYPEASEWLQKNAAQSDEAGQTASYYLGFCLLNQNKKEEARLAFKRASEETFQPDIQSNSLYQYGKLSMETRYYEEALSAFQRYIKQYPNGEMNGEIVGFLGEIYLYSRNYVLSVVNFEASPLKDNRTKEAYQRVCYYFGLDLLSRGVADSAKRYLKKAITIAVNPELTFASRYWYAEALTRDQAYVNAEDAYQDFLKSSSANQDTYYPQTLYGLAWVQMKQKKYTKAYTNFTQFANLKNNNLTEMIADARLRAGDCQFIQKKYSDAIQEYQYSVQLNLQGVDYALYQIGICYLRLSKYNNATEALVRLVNNYKSSTYRPQAIEQLAVTYLTWLNDYPQATHYGKMLIADYPNSQWIPMAYAYLALSAFNSKDEAAATNYFKIVLFEYGNATHAVKIALDGLSNILSPADYNRVYQQYREKNPVAKSELEDIVFNNAKDRYSSDDYENAIIQLTNYVKDYPKGEYIWEVYYTRGDCYEKLGQYEKALSDYEQVYSSNKSEDEGILAAKAAGEILMRQKKYPEAVKVYQRFDSLASGTTDKMNAQFGLGTAYLANQQYSEAAAIFNALVVHENITQYSKTRAKVLLGKAQYFLGKSDEAMKLFTEVEKDSKNAFGAESQYFISKILLDQKQYEQVKNAVIYLKNNYVQYHEWKARAFILMAESYYQLGEKFQALETMKSVAQNAVNQEIKEEAQRRFNEWEEIRKKEQAERKQRGETGPDEYSEETEVEEDVVEEEPVKQPKSQPKTNEKNNETDKPKTNSPTPKSETPKTNSPTPKSETPKTNSSTPKPETPKTNPPTPKSDKPKTNSSTPKSGNSKTTPPPKKPTHTPK